MKVTINVSKKHIREGDPRYSSCCIVQRAIRDAIPLALEVGVSIDHYALRSFDGVWTRLYLPREVEKFIWRTLDCHLPSRLRWLVLSPFSFELDVPDEFVAKEPVRPAKQEEVLQCVTS
jgi:hypothetical protein